MPAFHIRASQLSDLPAILSMVEHLAADHFTYDAERFVLSSPDDLPHVYKDWLIRSQSTPDILYLIAEETTSPIPATGYLIAESFAAQAQYWSPAHVYIHDIYCAAHARHSGLGHALIAHAKHWAKSKNITQIRGLIASENKAASAFFIKKGFRIAAHEMVYDLHE